MSRGRGVTARRIAHGATTTSSHARRITWLTKDSAGVQGVSTIQTFSLGRHGVPSIRQLGTRRTIAGISSMTAPSPYVRSTTFNPLSLAAISACGR